MFSESGNFPIANFRREQDEDVLTNLVLQLVEDRPMLQLNLRRAMVHVQRKQLLHEPPPDGGKAGAAYVPQQAAKMRGHAALALDAHYLNMNINELEPLIEPWVMSGHAVRPLGLRITSGRIYWSP